MAAGLAPVGAARGGSRLILWLTAPAVPGPGRTAGRLGDGSAPVGFGDGRAVVGG